MPRANPTHNKRQRELKLIQKRQQKAERVREAQAENERRRNQVAPGEDPDLAGIKPGPQPKAWDEFGPPLADAADADDDQKDE